MDFVRGGWITACWTGGTLTGGGGETGVEDPVPAKKNSPSIGEDDSQGCCCPPVTCFTATPMRLNIRRTSSPGCCIASLSALVKGLLAPVPSAAVLPGCVA